MATERIHYTELERLIGDDSTPDEVLATYVKPAPAQGGPLAPILDVDEAMVELPTTRGIIGLSVKSLNDRAQRRRLTAYRQRIDGGWKGLKLLAEGDSWFLYPILLHDVIDNLETDYAIYSEAAAGDTLVNMAHGMSDLEALIEQHRFQGFLLSAGGNDIAGAALRGYLRQQAPPPQAPESYLDANYATFLADTRALYDGMFARLTQRFPDLQIFCHGYDWPFPRAGGFWLAPAMLAQEVPSGVQASVLRLMIDSYYGMLAGLSDQYQGRVHLIDCRASVGDITEWFDELHPMNAGFGRAADRFRTKIDSVFGISTSTRSAKVARITWGPHEDRGASRREVRLLPVGSQVTIGRSFDREIRLDDPLVSRNHARFDVGAADIAFEDLGSTNGSRVDGLNIKRARWRPGQKLRIGNSAFTLEFVVPEASAPAPALVVPPAGPARGEGQPPLVPKAIEAPMAMEAPMADATPMAAESPPPKAPAKDGLRPIELVLTAGSIIHVAAPAYALGVFQGINPLGKRGSAYAIDAEVDGMLSSMVQSGVFDSRLGEISLLPTPRQRSLAELVVIAGLGAINAFAPRALEIVGENLAKLLLTARVFEFATVPIGLSAGLSVKDFATSFLTGFLRGLADADAGASFRKITICEIGKQRQAAIAEEVGALVNSDFFSSRGFAVTLGDAKVGGEESRDAPDDGAGLRLTPVFLQVASPTPESLEYCILSTELGAVIHSHRQTIDPDERNRISAMTARADRLDSDLGRALAKLYVPPQMRELIQRSMQKSTAHLVVIHDRASSTVPWEALHFDELCPALDAGLSRLYRVASRGGSSGRPILSRNAKLRMLVIENPTGDLVGAENEGKALTALFESNRGDVTVLTGPEATRAHVLRELGSTSYDILHYAGHADFVEARPGDSGLILSDGRLVSSDLLQVGRVPQLIFLNACESGRMRSLEGQAADAKGRYVGSGVSIAESFMLHGVINFIGTFWKVDDTAALQFATRFYEGLLTGKPLSLALREARQTIKTVGPRDWANYLHFGDPLYTLRLM